MDTLEIRAVRDLSQYPAVVGFVVFGAGGGALLGLVVMWALHMGGAFAGIGGAVVGGGLAGLCYLRKLRRIETERRIVIDKSGITYYEFNDKRHYWNWDDIENVLEEWETASDDVGFSKAWMHIKSARGSFTIYKSDFDDGYIVLRPIVKRRIPEKTKLSGYTYRSGLKAEQIRPIGQLFDAWHNPEAAKEAYDNALEAAKRDHNPNHPVLAKCFMDYSRSLQQLGQTQQAEKMAAQAREIQAHPEQDEPLLKFFWEELKKKRLI